MKKYRQSSIKPFSILTILCCLMSIIALVLPHFISMQFEWILLLFGMGIPLSVIFATVWIVSARNYLLIDDEKIIFPITRTPKLTVKRNTLHFTEIQYIRVAEYKGDKIISADTTFYCFVLKNGLKFNETFFSYGKTAEQEIVAQLKKHAHFL